MAKGMKKPKAKDGSRRRKKKVSVLTQEGIDYVDWKDVNLLRRFMSDRAKIRARQVTGNNQQQQKEIAQAIKNAREMALLPYNNRITTQRSASRTRDDNRVGGPAPQPSAPPPSTRAPGETASEELRPAEAIGKEHASQEETASEELRPAEAIGKEHASQEETAGDSATELLVEEAAASGPAGEEAPTEDAVVDEAAVSKAPEADEADQEAPAS